MENEFKDIDQIIREKLIGHTEESSPGFWFRLSARLNKKGGFAALFFTGAIIFGFAFWLIMTGAENETMPAPELTVFSEENIKMEETDIPMPIQKQKINEPENLDLAQSNSATVLEELNKKSPKPENEIVKEKAPKSAKIGTKKDVPFNKIEKKSGIQFLSFNEFPIKIGKAKIPVFEYVNKYPHKRSRISLSVELGLVYSWQVLQSDPETEALKMQRIANEKPISSSVYGLKFNYHYKNWVFSTGFDYSTLGEKLNYNIDRTVVDQDGGYSKVDTIWASVYNPETSWERMIVGYDINWVDEYKNENFTFQNYNRYSYIEVPVSIGYKFSKGRFGFQPSLGLSFGFLYSANGKLPQLDPAAFTEISNESAYLKPMATSLLFGFSAEYQIATKYSLFIKPFFKKGIGSVYQNYALSGSYKRAGIKIGINIYM
jgi:hypothetical protein